MKRADFVKTAAMVAALAVLLPVAAAYSADWSKNVNGYPIECSVNNISTIAGTWTQFDLKYSFCRGNLWAFSCNCGLGDGTVVCTLDSGPATQACNGATYRTPGYMSQYFQLKPGTANAQNYVCEQLFNTLRVTVTPLKK